MKRENYLDFLKGLAIIFVVVTHFPWSGSVRSDFLFPFWIQMAVPIFMIVSGYVSTKSFIKKSLTKFSELYNPVNLLIKLARYILPYIPYFLVVSIFQYVKGIRSISIVSLFRSFITGGPGPGGYYFPILIQFVFVIPLIYLLIKRLREKGLLLCLFINIAFESTCLLVDLNMQLYRLLIFRYLFLISWGCYTALGYRTNKYINGTMIIVGIVMAYLISYRGITLFLPPLWAATSFLASMFILPLFSYIIDKKISVKPFELLGKSSYNIYLTQMAFYYCIPYTRIENQYLQFFVCVSTCVVAGLIFYYIETPITKWITAKIKQFKF